MEKTGQISKKKIGQRIKRLRGALGFSQEELSEKAEMSVSGYRKVENGHVWPSPDNLNAICGALGIPPTSLFVIEVNQSDENLSLDDYKLLAQNWEALATFLYDQDYDSISADFKSIVEKPSKDDMMTIKHLVRENEQVYQKNKELSKKLDQAQNTLPPYMIDALSSKDSDYLDRLCEDLGIEKYSTHQKEKK